MKSFFRPKHLLVFTLFLFLFNACSSSDSEGSCNCSATQKFDTSDINSSTVFQSPLVNGGEQVRYIWFVNPTNICPDKPASGEFIVKVNNALVQIPITVTFIVIVDGISNTFTLEANNNEYSKQFIADFENVPNCFRTMQVRLQIEFDHIGISKLNDKYIDDIISFGALSASYYETE